jgi:hypothetical protein
MLTILVLAVGALMALVAVSFVIVVIGMRQEVPTEELSTQAPSLFAAAIRRMVGLYVRKPDPSLDERQSEPFPAARDAGGGECHCGHTRWSK